jgi:exopolysaccharide biosynthesis polyprenyl glycosylphosphotransferase
MTALRIAKVFLHWLQRVRGKALRRVLFIGANNRSLQFAALVRRQSGYITEGFLDDDPQRAAGFDAPEMKYLGTCADFDRVLDAHGIDEVYISLSMASFYSTIQRLVQRCEERGIDVHVKADFFQLQHARNLPMYVGDIPILSLTSVPESKVNLALKRALDFSVSSILLLMLAPLFLVIAVIIKIQSPGPVFFLQERIGQNQRRFKMFKFRSMVANAEQLRKTLEDKNEADGPVFKIRQDPRITPFGRFIRIHSIDELPQLINVWRGEMSLVGPRPPIGSEVDQYAWEQRRRLSVKPGMTGLWQVSGRSDVSFRQWVEMDLAYIDSWSVWQDIAILFRTFRIVIEGKGAA